MDPTATTPLFQYFDGLHALSAAARDAVAPLCKLLVMKKNDELQSIGHTCRTIYFIKKGLARIYYYKDHIDVTESFAFENQLVVRVESLFTGRPSRKGIQLLEPSEVIAIPSGPLFALYDAHPDLERLFRKIWEAGYVDTVNRLESLQFHTAEERYAALLTESPGILRRVPLKMVASYLGITQVSLSRIRAQRH